MDAGDACPDDRTHLLMAHAPGGSWWGRGHDGKPSPWDVGWERKEMRTKQDLEKVNHPAHYNQYVGLEIIDLVEQMNFNRGNAVKYITRAGLKDLGTEIEDLEKGRWYLDREIERLKKMGS